MGVFFDAPGKTQHYIKNHPIARDLQIEIDETMEKDRKNGAYTAQRNPLPPPIFGLEESPRGLA